MSAIQEDQEVHSCPQCSTKCSTAQLKRSDYCCPECSLELAYLNLSPAGSIQGVLGWLKSSGDMIGDRYRVQTVLGKGGFATTYLVEDTNLNGRKRAIKEIPSNLYDEQESQFLSKINHPSIPDITDRFSNNQMEYLVLKFGGSKTLESERKRHNGQVPVNEIRNWALQLCDVLGYLHDMDPPIIHRDLKPSNILLDDHDRIMLIDFGLAKESKPSEHTHRLACAVSHGFSSPEQTMSTGTDHRSDIYSLGATFYTLLSGIVPPSANDRLVSGKKVIPLSKLLPEIQAPLEKSIQQALELNPDNRQQNVAEIALIFEQLEDNGNLSVRQDRTTLLDPSTKPRHSTPTKGIKLPKSGKNEHAKPKIAEKSSNLKDISKESNANTIAIVGIIILTITLFLGLGWYFFSKGEEEKIVPPVAEIEKEVPNQESSEVAVSTKTEMDMEAKKEDQQQAVEQTTNQEIKNPFMTTYSPANQSNKAVDIIKKGIKENPVPVYKEPPKPKPVKQASTSKTSKPKPKPKSKPKFGIIRKGTTKVD